ncbi:AAA family ATPase [Streptomyces sp. SID13031]|uniref:helix-turn-helix transcriptional regulator n=1 Tax=Streptomyces sp. SID13031 TaxID=2706046 RepID=UPI0013CB3B94|nr:AAA family ATPase [Streptomyces sp. SID13031]NEA37363.1 AAA family ATPase [Streptomyces sp. SID13031]
MGPEILLERSAELDVLGGALDSAMAGRGSAIMISAAAGLGKTSLLRNLRPTAAKAGARVLVGRGSELEREYVYGVARQLFEPLLADAGPADRALWLAGAAAPAAQLVEGSPSTQPDVGGFAAMHSLYWLAANLAQARPLVIMIDDLHWADGPSVRFVSYLLGRLEELPLLLVTGARPAESVGVGELLEHVTNGYGSRHLQLSPLSPAATVDWLTTTFGRVPDSDFAIACHEASGGNPLLLSELARGLAAEQMPLTADNATHVLQVGAQAVARRVSLNLRRLGTIPTTAAEAVAVLGSRADVAVVAELARLPVDEATDAIAEIESMDLIRRVDETTHPATYEFVHPMVREAIYDRITGTRQIRYHSEAVAVLGKVGARAEELAAHLLRIPAPTGAESVTVLRQAARDALVRDAPEAAHTYLRRCLAEEISEADKPDLFREAGHAAQLVDTASAADYLEVAVSLETDPLRRAAIAANLGDLYLYLGRNESATSVRSEALRALPRSENDLSRSLNAGQVVLALLEPDRPDVFATAHQLRDLPIADTLGGRELAGVLSAISCYEADPVAVKLARHALEDDVLIQEAPGRSALVSAWLSLVVADDERAMESIENALAVARARGAVREQVGALSYQTLARLRRGDLTDAEADGPECMWAVDASRMHIARSYLGPWLAEVLIERGRLDAAEQAMDWVHMADPLPESGAIMHYLHARARLLREQGDHAGALKTAMLTGRRFTALGGDNPAIAPWRSEAALALWALGDIEQARAESLAEVSIAERFGAPGALGRALRIAGLCVGRADGLDLLERAVDTTRDSTARLEHAKALVEYGAALRRSGKRTEAVEHLRSGVEIASRCGATPLADQGAREMRAAGVRRRLTESGGIFALTPSERRVVELAIDHTNRDIAQQLYVTAKTVEVHLSNAYRKLGIANRRQLTRDLLAQERPHRRGGAAG